MKERKGCCETEYKFVKLQDEHQLAKTVVEFNQVAVETTDFPPVLDVLSGERALLALKYHSPPDPRVNSIYLHNSVFRI